MCSAIQLRSHQLQCGGFISLPVPKLFEAKVESRPFLLHVSGSVQISCLMAGYTSLCLFAKLGKGNIESRPLFSPPRLAQFKSIAEWQLAISTNPQRESRQNRPFLHRVWSSSVQFSCRVEGNLSACSQTLQSLLIISPLSVDQVNSVQFLNAFLTLFLSHVILHE